MNPVAFTYDAAVHCPECTFKRFGQEAKHRCAICREEGNTIPYSMAGQHHKYGPRFDHDFKAEVTYRYPWPREDARDSEGNEIGAIAPWDDWCNGEAEQLCTLTCDDCTLVIDTHGPHI